MYTSRRARRNALLSRIFTVSTAIAGLTGAYAIWAGHDDRYQLSKAEMWQHDDDDTMLHAIAKDALNYEESLKPEAAGKFLAGGVLVGFAVFFGFKSHAHAKEAKSWQAKKDDADERAREAASWKSLDASRS